MKHVYCPLSIDAGHQIKELTESYRLAIAAASDYNTISLANRKQVEAAIARADRLGEIIDCYINGWQNGIPCLLYSCGWEYCRRNLEILNCCGRLPKPFPPLKPNTYTVDNTDMLNNTTNDIKQSNKDEYTITEQNNADSKEDNTNIEKD